MTPENKVSEINFEKGPTSESLKIIEEEYVAPYEAAPLKIEQLDIQHEGDGLSQFLHDIAQYLPKEPNTREKDRQMFEAGERNSLFYSVVLMVVWQAKKWRNEKTPLMDSIQAANEQVLKFAIPSYNPDESKFSTWAMWWIRRGLRNERINNARPYHISHEDAVDVGKFQRTSEDFLGKTGRKPTPEELAVSTGFKPKKQRFLARLAGSTSISLSSTEKDDDGREMAEKIEDEEAIYGERLEDAIEFKEFIENLNKEIAKLEDPRYAQILKLRLGLDKNGKLTGEKPTLEEIGKRIGIGANKMSITRERVRQLQNRAVDRIEDYDVRSVLQRYLYPKMFDKK